MSFLVQNSLILTVSLHHRPPLLYHLLPRMPLPLLLCLCQVRRS